MSFGRSSLHSDSGPVVEDSVPSSGRVCGYGPLVSSHVELSMNLTELLGTPSVCASPFLFVDEPSSMWAKSRTRPYGYKKGGSRGLSPCYLYDIYLYSLGYHKLESPVDWLGLGRSVGPVSSVGEGSHSLRGGGLPLRHRVAYAPLYGPIYPYGNTEILAFTVLGIKTRTMINTINSINYLLFYSLSN